MTDKLSDKLLLEHKALVNATKIKDDVRQLRNTLALIGYDKELDELTNAVSMSMGKVCKELDAHVKSLRHEVDGDPMSDDYDECRCKFTSGHCYSTDDLVNPTTFVVVSRASIDAGHTAMRILMDNTCYRVTPHISVSRFWMGRATEYISFKVNKHQYVASSINHVRYCFEK